MKKRQNSAHTRLKIAKAYKPKQASGAHKTSHAAVNISSRIGYSDALIEVYHQEEKDIKRFAAFAKTLIAK